MRSFLNKWDDANGPAFAAQPRWYAVQTRSRHEKKLLLHLEHSGFSSFLPLLDRLSRWSDRQKLVQEPLFPGYVFVYLIWTPETRNLVLRQRGALALVGASGLGTPIPEKQIEDIQTLLRQKPELSTYPFLRAGDKVRVCGGVFDGIEGILVTQPNPHDPTLVISIDAIHRSLAIRIRGYEIEKV